MTITDIGNAVGAFIAFEWRNHDSPFDAWLAGDRAALTPEADRGRALFFGKAGCGGCHSGPLLSDQGFHALGLPAFGPGRTRRFRPPDPRAGTPGHPAEPPSPAVLSAQEGGGRVGEGPGGPRTPPQEMSYTPHASARQGFYWWEVDLTYYGLKLLAALGLVRDLKPVPGSVLARGRRS